MRSTSTSPSASFVVHLLEETRSEIDRADNKASIMLGGAGAVIAALVGVLLAANVEAAGVPVVAWGLAGATAASLVVSVALLGWAVHPRLGREVPGRARYFMDYAQYHWLDELTSAIAKELDDETGRHVQQLRALAAIAKTKYRLMVLGEWAAAFGLLCASLTAFAYAVR